MKIIAAVMALLTASSAVASDDEIHTRYHSPGMTVIFRGHATTIDLALGDNPIGNPASFNCRSPAGCVVVMAATVHVVANLDQTATCSFVDGVSGIPDCAEDTNATGDDVFTRVQQIAVAPGTHSIQTKVTTRQNGDQLAGWAFQYTIYERNVKGAN